MELNNILTYSEKNFLFLASVIAVLCEGSPITIDLKDIEGFWAGEIQRLQYDLVFENKQGCITFSLKEKL